MNTIHTINTINTINNSDPDLCTTEIQRKTQKSASIVMNEAWHVDISNSFRGVQPTEGGNHTHNQVAVLEFHPLVPQGLAAAGTVAYSSSLPYTYKTAAW